jgi:hypothetical protein
MLSLTKTERIINGIKKNDSFENVAYVCEDFETFIIEVAEWGVDHISQVDFDDPELDLEILDAFFASFGCVLTARMRISRSATE